MIRSALMISRLQPLHKGHTGVINQMVEDFDNVIIGLGSTGQHSEPKNPWTQVQRQTMLRNVYGSRIKIVPLEDIGAEIGANDWCDYVLNKIRTMKMPDVTDYFTGSRQDGVWYQGRFFNETFHKKPKDEHFLPDGTLRKLHIIDRTSVAYPVSATEVRGYLQLRTDDWKPLVPAVNHEFIGETYPDDFKVRI
jgi:cytidyltransferase-like protein